MGFLESTFPDSNSVSLTSSVFRLLHQKVLPYLFLENTGFSLSVSFHTSRKQEVLKHLICTSLISTFKGIYLAGFNAVQLWMHL